MIMNWDNIKYIFQIPLSWYKAIHDKVFNAYGTNFIIVRDGDQGGMNIDVDEGAFADMVNKYSADGNVKSVDGVTPDENGNVALSAIRSMSITDISGNTEYVRPDLSGDVNLSSLGVVRSVNSREPDEYGNVQAGTVRSVDHYSPDISGNIQMNAIRFINSRNADSVGDFKGVVTSINGQAPDLSGNINLSGGSVLVGVQSVNEKFPDQNGNVNVGTVRSVNDIGPDEFGNVELPELSGVSEEELSAAIADSEQRISGYIDTYVSDTLEDYPTNTDIDDKLLDYATLDDLSGYVQTVDGISPDSNGDVDFNLSASAWVKTDANGHLTTTSEKPLVLNGLSSENGYLYANSGVLEFKDEQYVDLSTQQTVKGEKTWSDSATFNSDVNINNPNNRGTGINISDGSTHSFILVNGLEGATLGLSLSTVGQDAFIAKTAQGLTVNDPIELTLKSPADKVELENHPTGASQLAVATVGYMQEQLSSYGKVKTVNNISPDANGNVQVPISSGAVRSVDHHSPDQDGNVQLNAICKINGHNGDSVGNFTGVVTSVNGQNPDAEGAVQLSGLVTENDLSDYVTEDDLSDYVTEDDLSDYVTEAEISGLVTEDELDEELQDYALTSDLDSFVDLTTDQTVAGNKTWSGQTMFTNDVTVQKDASWGKVSITGYSGTQTVNIYSQGRSAQFTIGVNYGGTDHFAIISENPYNWGGLILQESDSILLHSQADGVKLQNQPTSISPTSLAVATCGYVQTHLSSAGKVKTVNNIEPDANGNIQLTIPGGTVKSVDHVSPDQQGNVQLNAIRTINGHNGDSVGNFAGVVTSVNNETPDSDGNVELGGIVKSVNSIEPDSSGDVELTGFVKTVDGHSPDSSGAVNFNLASGKFVQTDANGNLTTTDVKVPTVDSNNNLISGTIKVVTSVTWDGTQLSYSSKQLTFKNGVLITNPSATVTSIDIPTKVAWS